MTIFAKAPARLGLGGGGTDIAEYFDLFGGAVLNVTINQYVYCRISAGSSGVVCKSIDKKLSEGCGDKRNKLVLHWEALRYFEDVFGESDDNICLTTYTDIPEGSGLGTSSALVVATVKALAHYFNISLSNSELVEAAFSIERERCNMAGGFQDYIAAVYGGINFTEFFPNRKYFVNPLKISNRDRSILENQIVLLFTGLSRSSSKIIADQIGLISDKERLEGMHQVKENAYKLKNALISSEFIEFRQIFQRAWHAKKSTSSAVSNQLIDDVEELLFKHGAEALKISGAGGGGFIMALASEEGILPLRDYVKQNYEYLNVSFTDEGVSSWKV